MIYGADKPMMRVTIDEDGFDLVLKLECGHERVYPTCLGMDPVVLPQREQCARGCGAEGVSRPQRVLAVTRRARQ